MYQVLKPLETGVLSVVLLIGIVALTAELSQYEEIAKVVVVPALVLSLLQLQDTHFIKYIRANQLISIKLNKQILFYELI